jgi:Fe-S-cluster containining protein
VAAFEALGDTQEPDWDDDDDLHEVPRHEVNSKDKHYACDFLDQGTHLCTSYDTRPWACRVFDCDGKDREELAQLGVTAAARVTEPIAAKWQSWQRIDWKSSKNTAKCGATKLAECRLCRT